MTVMEPQSKTRTRREGSDRRVIVAVMITSLLFAAATRYLADARRELAIPTQGSNAGAASLGSLNSFALGLLLGGLRGPLVMILWTDSENNKSAKNLEGVDTQIELIRLLQPEFDTVHIFQIWNKAYNISVQMASMANKYDVILSALDYAAKVDSAKPDDINILAAVAQIYFDKLGTSSEKFYYRRRVRDETLPHEVDQKARRQDPGWRRVHLDPLLDSSFRILPALTRPVPGRERPKDLPVDQEWDDGSTLQYLPQFEPYIDGVSTFGLAYNYYKRSEVLQSVMSQHHDQLSDQVIDGRPAISLKYWAEEELDQAHRREVQAFGATLPEDPDEVVSTTEGIGLTDIPKDANAVKLAIAGYDHAANLFPASQKEYVRFILNVPERELQTRSYLEEMRAEVQLAIGDGEYLKAMTLPAAEQHDHLVKAMAAYEECRHQSYFQLLRYYIDPDIMRASMPTGFGLARTANLKAIEDMTLQQATETVYKATILKQRSRNQYVNTDRYEFDRMVNRSIAREKAIAQLAHP